MAQTGHKGDQLPGQPQDCRDDGKKSDIGAADQGSSQEAVKQAAGE